MMSNAQKTTIKVLYKIILNENSVSEKMSLMSIEQKQVYQNTNNAFKDLALKLVSNFKLSTVILETKMNTGSAMDSKFAALKITKGRDWMYNIEDKTALFRVNYMGENISVSSDLYPYNWKISAETKKVNGYDCIKATTSSTYISRITNSPIVKNIDVWFAPKIPCVIAPNSLNGLPGLALEIIYDDFAIIVEKIDFDASDLINVDFYKIKTHFNNEADFLLFAKNKTTEIRNRK